MALLPLVLEVAAGLFIEAGGGVTDTGGGVGAPTLPGSGNEELATKGSGSTKGSGVTGDIDLDAGVTIATVAGAAVCCSSTEPSGWRLNPH